MLVYQRVWEGSYCQISGGRGDNFDSFCVIASTVSLSLRCQNSPKKWGAYVRSMPVKILDALCILVASEGWYFRIPEPEPKEIRIRIFLVTGGEHPTG